MSHIFYNLKFNIPFFRTICGPSLTNPLLHQIQLRAECTQICVWLRTAGIEIFMLRERFNTIFLVLVEKNCSVIARGISSNDSTTQTRSIKIAIERQLTMSTSAISPEETLRGMSVQSNKSEKKTLSDS